MCGSCSIDPIISLNCTKTKTETKTQTQTQIRNKNGKILDNEKKTSTRKPVKNYRLDNSHFSCEIVLTIILGYS